MLDSGIDRNHPDLSNAVVGEQCFCQFSDGSACCPSGDTTQEGDGSAQDDNGHGTWVSGVITSDGNVSSVGVSPGTGIVAVKVNNRTNSGLVSDLISGLDWLITNRADVRVVNISISTRLRFPGICDEANADTMGLANAIDTLRDRGTIVFAAAGNSGDAVNISAPACIGSAFGIAAVYDSNVGLRRFAFNPRCQDTFTSADQITCYSNSNTKVAFVAPGSIITTDKLGGGTEDVDGTSFASPHAAGTAALLLETDPTLTVDDIERHMQQTPVHVTDGRNLLTFPRVDALSAVESTRIRTDIEARASIAEALPGLGVFLNFAATMRRAGGDKAPVPGADIVFSAGQFQCTGRTDQNGAASCGGVTDQLNAVLNFGYSAIFEGTFAFQPSSAHGPLLDVAGFPVP